MSSSNMFNNTNLLGMALDATWTRNNVISQNIANVDTPNYKRQDVSFEDEFQRALSRTTDYSELSASRLQPSVYTENAQLSYRSDGNNVDVDTEMVYLAENQIRYNTLISQVSYDFARLKTVIK